MTEDPAVKTLVDRARQGDLAAFEQLATLARGPLLEQIRFLLGKKLREKLDLEDVLQDVFLRAYKSVEYFKGQDGDSFRRWLTGIARNVISSHGRKRRGRSEIALVQDPPGSHVFPSRAKRRHERFERLSRAVEGLKPDYRTVIRLCRIEGPKILCHGLRRG